MSTNHARSDPMQDFTKGKPLFPSPSVVPPGPNLTKDEIQQLITNPDPYVLLNTIFYVHGSDEHEGHKTQWRIIDKGECLCPPAADEEPSGEMQYVIVFSDMPQDPLPPLEEHEVVAILEGSSIVETLR